MAELASSRRHWASARPIDRFVLIVAVAITFVGCGFAKAPGTQGDPAAPVIVRGTVRDDSGAPIARAGLRLTVLDYANPGRDPREPVIFSGQFVADVDGTFVIHLGVTHGLESFAETYGPWVPFDLIVSTPESIVLAPGSLIASTQFTRQLEGGAWVDAAPVLRVTPSGVTFDGVAPRPPPPAET